MKEDEKMKRGIALFLGIIMIATVFAALPTVNANPHYSESNAWNIQITDDTLTSTYYPGEQDVSFKITIKNVDGGGESDNDQIDSCDVSINTATVRDADGNTVTSPISNWDVNTDNWGQDLANGAFYQFGPFQFDIAGNAVPGEYNLTIQMSFNKDSDSSSHTFTGYVLFTIADNIAVADAYTSAPSHNLYAGQTFTNLYIHVNAHWNNVNNLYLNLSSIPNGITFDSLSGWTSTHNLPATLGYKVDVARDMAAGVYTVDYQVQYDNNDGEWCTETGTLDITVDFTPVIEAQLTGNNTTIIQGNASINALGVTFTNTGNVNLRDITIDMDYDGFFFYASTDYYEGNGGTDDQNPVQVTEVHIDSLDVGHTAEGSWFVAVNPYVQAGQHKLLFDWDATYFDNGTTGNPTNYVDASLSWVGANPMTPRCSVYSGEWIAGPYVMIGVVDDHPDFSADKMRNEDTWNDYFDLSNDDLVNVEVYSSIHNFELVDFTDVHAALQVGSGTPFTNPTNQSAVTVMNDMADSDDSIDADNDADMDWYVNINPDTTPGTYTVDITLTGRNADTTQYITTTMPVVVEVRGFGPELVVSSVTTGDIEPGKVFNLNLTIQNMGDDTARDVFVSIPGTTGYNWNVINGFVSAISSNNANKVVVVPDGEYENASITIPGVGHEDYEYIEDGSLNRTNSKNTEFSGVTLEQLNINDAKDIVDLSLYIEGVYDSPTAQIWLMKAQNLAPGQSVTLTFNMQTNVNMVKGRPYVINVVTGYTDSYGDEPDPTFSTQEITIRTADSGTAYHEGSFLSMNGGNTGLLLLVILLLIFIVLIVGLGMKKNGKKKKSEPESEEMDYTPEPLPPEEGEVAPEELEDPATGDMGPGPGYEEASDEPGFSEEDLETTDEGESSF